MTSSHILPVAWLCSTCGADATHYVAAHDGRPVVALPCGHANLDGLTWVVGEHRGQLGRGHHDHDGDGVTTFHGHTVVGP